MANKPLVAPCCHHKLQIKKKTKTAFFLHCNNSDTICT